MNTRTCTNGRHIDERLAKLQELHPHRRYGRGELASATGIHFNTLARIERTALLKLRSGLRALNPRMFDELAVKRTVAL